MRSLMLTKLKIKRSKQAVQDAGITAELIRRKKLARRLLDLKEREVP